MAKYTAEVEDSLPEDDVEAEAYDYGLDDMDISYSQDSVDITENVPDDGGEIEEPAVQELPKPAVSTSVANTVSNTASAAAVDNLSKTSIEVQPPPQPLTLAPLLFPNLPYQIEILLFFLDRQELTNPIPQYHQKT